MTYQQRCAIQALKHSAHSLGYLAMGNEAAAEVHGRAATKWGDAAVAAENAVKNGTPQWMLDAVWVEPVWPEADD